jgi:hypothetical protein
MALIHGREKGIIMDVLTRRLEQKWSRGTAHKTWGLEERWNKHGKSKREIVSSLISDRGKKTVSVLGHFILLPYRKEESVSSYIEKI